MKSTQRFFRAGVIAVMLVLVGCITAAFAAQQTEIGGLQVVSQGGGLTARSRPACLFSAWIIFWMKTEMERVIQARIR